MPMSRRRFLAMTGAVAAATGLPAAAVAEVLAGTPGAARAAADHTTLARRFGPGAPSALGYRLVRTLAGEGHVVRDELAAPQPGREGRRVSLACFAHLTDQHVIDVQSTTRVEFLDRYADGECDNVTFFSSAHRPHEAANARMADAMLRALREVQVSPVTGVPIGAAICTGDNTDNRQENELGVFLSVMNGGPVAPQSGAPTAYEGVQRSGDPAYWHPEGDVDDRYRRVYGFPEVPGFLEAALAPFDAVGAGVPWYTCYGNHDGLAQGNAPVNPAFQAIAVGPAKVVGLPPGTDPCNELDDLGFLPVAPTRPTTADPGRRYLARREWIQGHLESGGLPAGHGFTSDNAERNLAYYVADVQGLRWIVLDTVNPAGLADGSVGQEQLDWLDAQLAVAQEERRLVVLLSHHGLRSLTNKNQAVDPLEPGEGDNPRRLADEVLAVVGRYPCVVAWVSGHTHENIVTPRRGSEVDPDLPGAFWDVGTAAHIDWPCQSRIVEVVDNRDGTLSVFGTLVDFADDPIVNLARELAGNDPQKGFGYGDGAEEDRNVELLLAHPFPEQSAGPPAAAPAAAQPEPSPAATPRPVEPSSALPATGMPGGLMIGGALALMAGVRMRTQPYRGSRDGQDSSAAWSVAGRRTSKQAPSPDADSAVTVPSWAVTMPRTMNRPRPVEPEDGVAPRP